ncbi:MAG TPA: hypothetical protein VN256_16690 [Pyrinomonadaceae bacterium]|nr:hypothetical protein [Pyrinomonadaceae bacterium]
MPVIGRLDDQVWKAIIEPIARRHEREPRQEEPKREKQESTREEEAPARGEKKETD